MTTVAFVSLASLGSSQLKSRRLGVVLLSPDIHCRYLVEDL